MSSVHDPCIYRHYALPRVSVFEALSDWAYRRPWVLLVAGVVAAMLGSALKGIPILLKGVPNVIWRQEDLDLAILLVDPLVGGMASGLVASAVLLKLQVLHAKAQISARNDHEFATEVLERAKANFDRVTKQAGEVPSQELEQMRSHAFESVFRAIGRRQRAEDRLEEVNVPGLGEMHKPASNTEPHSSAPRSVQRRVISRRRQRQDGGLSQCGCSDSGGLRSRWR